jgi:hypothetical protein
MYLLQQKSILPGSCKTHEVKQSATSWLKDDQHIKQSICHRFSFQSIEVFSSLFIIIISIFDLKIMARREYHVVLILIVFADCCFLLIPISIAILLYFISKYNMQSTLRLRRRRKRCQRRGTRSSRKRQQRMVAVVEQHRKRTRRSRQQWMAKLALLLQLLRQPAAVDGHTGTTTTTASTTSSSEREKYD